jgi:hypothetical protein
MGYCATLIGSYRRFGAAYRSGCLSMGPTGCPEMSDTTNQRCAISQESEDFATALPSEQSLHRTTDSTQSVQIIINLPS